MFSKYDTPSYLTSREVDPLYSRLLIEECDETGEVTQMLWAGLTKGNEVPTDLKNVNKLLGSIDISRKVMFFHVFMKIIHLPSFVVQFRTSLLQSIKVHFEKHDLRLPNTMAVHRGVVANSPFMNCPTILRADQDFMVHSS
jgi:hypothetical protein